MRRPYVSIAAVVLVEYALLEAQCHYPNTLISYLKRAT